MFTEEDYEQLIIALEIADVSAVAQILEAHPNLGLPSDVNPLTLTTDQLQRSARGEDIGSPNSWDNDIKPRLATI